MWSKRTKRTVLWTWGPCVVLPLLFEEVKRIYTGFSSNHQKQYGMWWLWREYSWWLHVCSWKELPWKVLRLFHLQKAIPRWSVCIQKWRALLQALPCCHRRMHLLPQTNRWNCYLRIGRNFPQRLLCLPDLLEGKSPPIPLAHFQPFGPGFYQHEGLPYCEPHYLHKLGVPLCGGCNEAIKTGPAINALGKKWHPEHFVCSFCMTPLSSGYQESDGKPFCQTCYGNMF